MAIVQSISLPAWEQFEGTPSPYYFYMKLESLFADSTFFKQFVLPWTPTWFASFLLSTLIKSGIQFSAIPLVPANLVRRAVVGGLAL
jgi:hypothetical protein